MSTDDKRSSNPSAPKFAPRQIVRVSGIRASYLARVLPLDEKGRTVDEDGKVHVAFEPDRWPAAYDPDDLEPMVWRNKHDKSLLDQTPKELASGWEPEKRTSEPRFEGSKKYCDYCGDLTTYASSIINGTPVCTYHVDAASKLERPRTSEAKHGSHSRCRRVLEGGTTDIICGKETVATVLAGDPGEWRACEQHAQLLESEGVQIRWDPRTNEAKPERRCGRQHACLGCFDCLPDAALGIDDHAIAGMLEYLVGALDSASTRGMSPTPDLARNVREARKRAQWLRVRAEQRTQEASFDPSFLEPSARTGPCIGHEWAETCVHCGAPRTDNPTADNDKGAKR